VAVDASLPSFSSARVMRSEVASREDVVEVTFDDDEGDSEEDSVDKSSFQVNVGLSELPSDVISASTSSSYSTFVLSSLFFGVIHLML
jgi:hypothetical protein